MKRKQKGNKRPAVPAGWLPAALMCSILTGAALDPGFAARAEAVLREVPPPKKKKKRRRAYRSEVTLEEIPCSAEDELGAT